MRDEQDERGREEPQESRPAAPASYRFPTPPDGLLPWSHAVERLERARNYWLATTRPNGLPHVTPVWGVWVDEALYFDGHPTTRWASNIKAHPAMAAHLESGDDVVTDANLAARIVTAWAAKYGRLLPEPAESGMFRLQPHAARAWSTASLEDGTMWHFGDA